MPPIGSTSTQTASTGSVTGSTASQSSSRMSRTSPVSRHTSTAYSGSSSITEGTKLGLGVGIFLGVIVIALLILLWWKLDQRNKLSIAAGRHETGQAISEQTGAGTVWSEPVKSDMDSAEAKRKRLVELDGYKPPAEADGVRVNDFWADLGPETKSATVKRGSSTVAN